MANTDDAINSPSTDNLILKTENFILSLVPQLNPILPRTGRRTQEQGLMPKNMVFHPELSSYFFSHLRSTSTFSLLLSVKSAFFDKGILYAQSSSSKVMNPSPILGKLQKYYSSLKP